MAEGGKTSDDDDGDEVRDLQKEISQLQLHKTTLFHELEKIAQRERECVDKQHSLAEKHDREKQKQAVERLIEVESELKHFVKSENAKLSDAIVQLKASLDQAEKYSKTQKPSTEALESRVIAAENELSLTTAAAEAKSERDTSTISKLQKQLHETRKQLNETTEELSGTRQRLSEVQERLTLAVEVTAATQQRALQESGNSDELQLELTPQQSTTHSGDVWIF